MSALRIVACAAFPRAGASPIHDLVRAFRAGDEAAFEKVLALVRAGLAREAPDVASADDVVLAVIPGHRAGSAPGPMARLAAAIADDRPGWRVEAGLVARVADAPEGKNAPARDAGAEAATLHWGPVPGGGPVLLLDDVVRTGASLEAARLAAPPRVRQRIVGLVAFRALG